MKIDKSKIRPQSKHMKRGGNQILEIMEKEFSLDYIKNHYEQWKILDVDFNGFVIWCNSNFSITKARKECFKINKERERFDYFFGQSTISAIVNTLYKHIDIVPKFNDNDEIVDKYSFLEYQVIDILDTSYRAIFPKVIRQKFSGKLHKYLKEKLERVIVLENQDGQWVEINNKWAKEYRKSIKVLEKLSG